MLSCGLGTHYTVGDTNPTSVHVHLVSSGTNASDDQISEPVRRLTFADVSRVAEVDCNSVVPVVQQLRDD